MNSLCFVLMLGLLVSQAALAAAPVEVKTAQPVRGDIVRYVAVPGTIRANQQAVLCAKVAGYLTAIAVDKGDRVTAGQELARLEIPELAADLVKFHSDVKVAEVQCNRLLAAQKKAPDLVLPSAVDEAQGRVDTAKASLERAETLLRYAKISAPFAGVVTARAADAGAFIAAGGPLVTLADFATVRAQVALPELEAALVKTGQPVRVSVEALVGKVFEGRVSRLAYALDEATRTMLVEADLPNGELTLRPGMYATIQVGVEKHTDALLIPSEALVMEKAHAFVFLAANGKAKKLPIKIGFNDGAKVEVLSGLTGGEPVLLVGKLALADGAAIQVVEAQ